MYIQVFEPDAFVVFLKQKLSEVLHSTRDEVTGLLPEPDVVTRLRFVLILVTVAMVIITMILVTVTLESWESRDPLLDSHRRPGVSCIML